MLINAALDELLNHFGSIEAFAGALELDISTLQRLRDSGEDISSTERALVLVLLRALKSSVIDFLLVDKIILGLEEPERSAPAGLTTLSNSYLYDLLEAQFQLLEVQRLVIEYYQKERAPDGSVNNDAGDV